jgi:prefoldin subunit 5
MTEETTNLVLEHLRRIREEIGTLRSEMREELGDLKLRTSALEQSVARGFDGMQSMISQIQVSMGSFHRRTDRIEVRSDSIETRLDRLEGFSETTEDRLAKLEERMKKMDA